MLVDKQSELMSDLLFTVHQHGGDDVTWKPPDNNTHFFSLLSVSKFKSFILNLRHKTHGKLNASSFLVCALGLLH